MAVETPPDELLLTLAVVFVYRRASTGWIMEEDFPIIGNDYIDVFDFVDMDGRETLSSSLKVATILI